MEEFCDKKNVRGHICFLGGNPFLSPIFFKLYQTTADKGFSTSILSNAVEEKQLQKIIDIQIAGYYQVSLEGLENHNDSIRSRGYFSKVFNFLKMLTNMIYLYSKRSILF